MQDICHAALGLFGEAATAVAVYEKQADRLLIQAAAGLSDGDEAPEVAAGRKKRFASLVIHKNCTACLNDASLRPT